MWPWPLSDTIGNIFQNFDAARIKLFTVIVTAESHSFGLKVQNCFHLLFIWPWNVTLTFIIDFRKYYPNCWCHKKKPTQNYVHCCQPLLLAFAHTKTTIYNAKYTIIIVIIIQQITPKLIGRLTMSQKYLNCCIVRLQKNPTWPWTLQQTCIALFTQCVYLRLL